MRILRLLSGIKPERVILVTWILVGVLASVAGTLYGLDKGYKPFVYLQLVLPIFAAAIVGGVGNPIGAVAGGYIIAFSEAFITFAYKRFLFHILFQRNGLQMDWFRYFQQNISSRFLLFYLL